MCRKMWRSWWIKQFKPLSPVRMDWECAFVLNLLNYFPGRWSWKSNVVLETVLEKSLKTVAFFVSVWDLFLRKIVNYECPQLQLPSTQEDCYSLFRERLVTREAFVFLNSEFETRDLRKWYLTYRGGCWSIYFTAQSNRLRVGLNRGCSRI